MAGEYNPPTADDADFNFELGDYTPKHPLDADFNFVAGVYQVLAGTSNIFTAVWANPDAGLENGKFYALSWGSGVALSVLDLGSKELYDHYTQTYGGRGAEILIDVDTKDLNVNTL